MNIGIDFLKDLAVTETAMDVYGYIESGFDCVVRYCILALEMVGVFVLMGSVLRAIIGIFRKKENLRLQLAEGIALSLEFKIGGELLRTVIAREWKELWVVGIIILFRAALTFLIQWEIRIERRNDAERQAKNEKLGESKKNTEESH